MKTEDLIKYGAMALGGYLLYVYLRDNCYLAQFGMAGSAGCYQTTAGWQVGVPPTATVAAASTNPAATGTQANVGQPPATTATNTTPPPAAASTVAPPTVQQITLSAALGDPTSVSLADAAGIQYDADQWNFFRNQADPSQPITTVDLFPAGNRTALMSASQYIAARHTAGLSGVHGYYPAMRGIGGWTN